MSYIKCSILFLNLFVFSSTYSQLKKIDTIEQVKLGGIEQTILVRGNDVSKPILLILHGGPGFSEFIFFRTYNKELEKEFMVVNWEQRGTGLSYNDSIPSKSMTISQIVADANELVVLLKKRFKKEKIFLLAHSWGTIIGIHLVSQYPENFYCYVGAGQMVNGMENEKHSLQFTIKQAKIKRNTKAIEELETLAKTYPVSDSTALPKLFVQRNWLQIFGGVFYGNMNYEKLFKNVAKAEMDLYNNKKASKGEQFSMKNLWPQIMDVDLAKTNPALNVPVYFVLGKNDYNTPFKLAENYLKLLKAPKKKLVWFSKSGHFMPFEESEKFNSLMMNEVIKEMESEEHPAPNSVIKF